MVAEMCELARWGCGSEVRSSQSSSLPCAGGTLSGAQRPARRAAGAAWPMMSLGSRRTGAATQADWLALLEAAAELFKKNPAGAVAAVTRRDEAGGAHQWHNGHQWRRRSLGYAID
eukprot:4062610-Pleurochrysis_carterae.AAC.1